MFTMNKLTRQILAAFAATGKVWNAQDGAAGGEEAVAVDPEVTFSSDEEAEFVKNSIGGDAEEKPEDTEEEPAEETPEVKPAKQQKKEAAPQAEETEFVDDILPGLKSTAMTALPKEVQEIVVSTREKLDAAEKQVKEYQERIAAIEKDPIAKINAERAAKGLPPDIIAAQPSDELVSRIVELIDSGKVEQAKAEIFQHATRAADSIANQRVLEADNTRKHTETVTSAGKVMLEAIKAYPDLDVGEIDAYTLATITPEHPAYSKYEQGVGKVVDELLKMHKNGAIGNVAQYVAQMGPRKMMALIADVHNKPLVLNADDKINEQVAKARQETIERFRRPKGVASRIAQKPGSVDRSAAKQNLTDDGIDITKLDDTKEGQAYMDRLLTEAGGDQKKLEKIQEAYLKGARQRVNPD